MGLRAVAEQLGVPHATVRWWWKEGRIVGRTSGTQERRGRVIVPVEVVEFYLRYLRLPSKLELFESGALTREFLLDLSGPDGGLLELDVEAGGRGAAAGE